MVDAVDVVEARPAMLGPPSTRRRLLEAGTELRLDAGRVIHRQGDPATGLCMVTEGLVRLSVALGDGHALAVGEVGPGDVFSIVSAVDCRPQAATATTMGECRVVVVGLRRLHDLMEHDAQVSAFLVRQLAGQLRLADERLVQHSSRTTLDRVADRLRRLHSASPGPRIETTQRELADWVGATRESTARALAQLRDAGAIETGRGWIEVVDQRRLVDAAE